ncbi:hypothetical protein [Microbispora sp. NPDC049125]|uniref:hypothetical protein n=1 Tax=Microbispora sp. NPDC049125 TaxID=3154929 RepID=UPI003467DF53
MSHHQCPNGLSAGSYPHLRMAAAGRPLGEVPVEFLPSNPTTRHGLSRLVLRPGVIDDAADEFFAWGYCWLLAAALHEVTGWPFGLIERWREDGQEWEWTHVGVITPAGRFLDIRGCHDRAVLTAGLTGAYGMPTRIRTGRFPALRQAMRMAEDTPPDWWLGALTDPILTETVRYFAAHLINQVCPATEVA